MNIKAGTGFQGLQKTTSISGIYNFELNFWLRKRSMLCMFFAFHYA
ncbi:hypothetical protein MIDIC_140080 [Alphaproteobacteria bacterium]